MTDGHLLHATAVEIDGAAVLLKGKSGSGKSSLALQLLALGARLIADDQIALKLEDNEITMFKPSSLPDLIEARHVGLITVPMTRKAILKLVVDLDENEEERLPHSQATQFLGRRVTKWRNSTTPHFPAAIFLYLKNISSQIGDENETDL